MKNDIIKISEIAEEGIIQNDTFSKFELLGLSKQNKFPYCFVGKTNSEFKSKKISKFGVGMLIGPSIFLTAGHNLTNIDKNTGELEIADNINFTVGANGDFEPFETVSSNDFYIPEEFINGIKEQVGKTQLLNDWSVVYLNVPIGESVKKLYNIEKLSYVQTENNGLFSFFNDNFNQNIKKLHDLNPEISIIGYSEYIDGPENLETDNCNFVDNINNNITNSSFIKKNHENEDSKKEKDININIQISTKQEEGLTHSQIFSNSLNIVKLEKSNNIKKNPALDYIIMDSQSNLNKNTSTENNYNSTFINNMKNSNSGKTFMSESKGKLEDIEEALKYKISTYKGQSGSPIFLRVKKFQINNDENQNNLDLHNPDYNNNITDSDYFYIFIGIHSRRGPLLYDHIVCNPNNSNFELENNYNEEDNNFLGISNNGVFHDDEVDKVETQVTRMKSKSIVDRPLGLNEKADSKDLMNAISIHGICEYNEGILLMGNNCLPISSAVEQRNNKTLKKVDKTVNNNIFGGNTAQNSNDNFQLSYYNTKTNKILQNLTKFTNVVLNLNDRKKLEGIFNRDIKMETLFVLASEIIKIDKMYLKLITFGKTEKRINGQYDLNKSLSLYLEKDHSSTISTTFEIEVNMIYGDELGEIVLKKYMQNYDVTIDQIKENFKKVHMKALFDYIFDEIFVFHEIQPIYGKLFAKIRSFVLQKIGLSD